MVVIGLTIVVFLIVASLQPFFLGNEAYFGVDARLICCPIAFLALPLLVIHLYQGWPLFRAAVKKRKIGRFGLIIGIAIVGIIDISSGWRSAIAGQSEYILIPMWAWSWLFTLLIVVHVWQRRTVFQTYFKRRKERPV